MVCHRSQITALVLLLSLQVFFLGACGRFERLKETPAENIQADDETSIGFEQVQQEVFLASCQGCHQANGQFTFENYDTVVLRLNAINTRVFVFGDMPPRGLASDKKALLQRWLEQGAPE